VWSWRPDAGAKFSRKRFRGSDGGKRARSPGRARISRKTSAQGRPDDPPVPVVLPRAFCCTRTMGAVGTRPSLRPLISEGLGFQAQLGRNARRECGFMSSCRLKVETGRLRERHILDRHEAAHPRGWFGQRATSSRPAPTARIRRRRNQNSRSWSAGPRRSSASIRRCARRIAARSPRRRGWCRN
jgi:hypothetical protein